MEECTITLKYKLNLFSIELTSNFHQDQLVQKPKSNLILYMTWPILMMDRTAYLRIHPTKKPLIK